MEGSQMVEIAKPTGKAGPEAICRYEWEKLPNGYRIENAAQAVSAASFSEKNLQSKPRELSRGTSARNPAHVAIELPISRAIQHLCSNLAVGASERELIESSLCGRGTFAPAGQPHSIPASSSEVDPNRG